MTYRFAFRGFALLPFHALLLLLFSPQVSGAQGSSSTPSAANTATPTAQAMPNVSKGVKERGSTEGITALLTRENTPVSSNRRPMLVEKAEVPNTSFIRETYRSEWRTGDPSYIPPAW